MTSTALAGTYSPTLSPTPLPTLTLQSWSILPDEIEQVVSSACPEGDFSPENLDPQWALACSHCYEPPAQDTPTPGGIPIFSTPQPYVVPSIAFSTFTPRPSWTPLPPTATETPNVMTPTGTYTATSTYTPTFIPTPSGFSWVYNFDDRHDGNFDWDTEGGFSETKTGYAGYGGGNTTYSSVVGSVYQFQSSVQVDLGTALAGHLKEIRFRYKQDGTATYNWQMDIWFGSSPGDLALRGSGSYGLVPNSAGWQLGSLTSINNSYRYVLLYTYGNQESVSTLNFTWDDVEFIFDGVTPTPGAATNTPTVTYTPSATGTPPTATPTVLPPTPNRGSLLRANCQVPKYVSHSTPVDISIDPLSSVCFTLFPGVSAQTILGLHIDTIAGLEVCLAYYNVTFQVMGIIVDIPLMITVAFAFVVLRWALTS